MRKQKATPRFDQIPVPLVRQIEPIRDPVSVGRFSAVRRAQLRRHAGYLGAFGCLSYYFHHTWVFFHSGPNRITQPPDSSLNGLFPHPRYFGQFDAENRAQRLRVTDK